MYLLKFRLRGKGFRYPNNLCCVHQAPRTVSYVSRQILLTELRPQRNGRTSLSPQSSMH